MAKRKKERRGQRPYAIEMHPKSQEIVRKLAEGVNPCSVAAEYKIDTRSVRNYVKKRMPEVLAKVVKERSREDRAVKAAERRSIADAQELFEIILKAVRRMETLSDSCDDYLQDPDNPGNYYMGPRAHEIDVIYLIKPDDGPPVRRRETLQNIITRIEQHDMLPTEIHSKHTDPRILLVKASETLTKQMDTLVNAWQTVDGGKSSFLGTPAWNQVVDVILQATEKAPEIRRKIADGLSKITE